jgi:K+-sensing histidine kinase KdpD
MNQDSFYSAILESHLAHFPAFLGIFELPNIKPIIINPAGLQMFEVESVEEYIQRYPFGVLKQPITPETVQRIVEKTDKQNVWVIKSVCLTHSGQTISVWVNSHSFCFDSKEYLMVRIVDIAQIQLLVNEQNLPPVVPSKSQLERLKLEQLVAQRTTAMIEALEELEKSKKQLAEIAQKEHELNHVKSKFITAASHELRTPLAVMQTSLTLLRKHSQLGNQEKQQEFMTEIESQIGYLNNLLQKIVSFDFEDKNHSLDLHQLAADIKAE